MRKDDGYNNCLRLYKENLDTEGALYMATEKLSKDKRAVWTRQVNSREICKLLWCYIVVMIQFGYVCKKITNYHIRIDSEKSGIALYSLDRDHGMCRSTELC